MAAQDPKNLTREASMEIDYQDDDASEHQSDDEAMLLVDWVVTKKYIFKFRMFDWNSNLRIALFTSFRSLRLSHDQWSLHLDLLPPLGPTRIGVSGYGNSWGELDRSIYLFKKKVLIWSYLIYGSWFVEQDRGPLVTKYQDFPEGSHISFQEVCKLQSSLRADTKKDLIFDHDSW